MAKESRNLNQLAAQVAEQAMPGWKAVKETSLDAPDRRDSYSRDSSDSNLGSTADAVMPTTEQLRAKYLGARTSQSVHRDSATDVAEHAADTALVELESGPLKKTVAVSKSQKKVIWSQG